MILDSSHAPYGSQCFCDDCRATRERAVTANAGRIRPLFSPPVVTPVAAVGGSTATHKGGSAGYPTDGEVTLGSADVVRRAANVVVAQLPQTSGACLGKSAPDTHPGPAGRVPGLPSLMVADGEPRLWGVSS